MMVSIIPVLDHAVIAVKFLTTKAWRILLVLGEKIAILCVSSLLLMFKNFPFILANRQKAASNPVKTIVPMEDGFQAEVEACLIPDLLEISKLPTRCHRTHAIICMRLHRWGLL